ncbi:hypothetical protein NPIL_181731 [Nephila pilipes]|uniref:Uncharacterized protein n=1 Tax=Nephila pilipes TaxID=299642 RepID=A0A8X6PFT7_NEPPI|nr:hypothetical protein NPIL_181731 [Nephila pilipes]
MKIENNFLGELESIGIKHEDFKNSEENQALKTFNRTTIFQNDCYEVQLPWKREWRDLTVTLLKKKQRLQSLQNRLRRTPNMYSEYSEIIKIYLKQIIIERGEETR